MKIIGRNIKTNKLVYGQAFPTADSHGFPLVEYYSIVKAEGAELSFDEYIGDALAKIWTEDQIVNKIHEAFTESFDFVDIEVIKERVILLARYFYCDTPKSGLTLTGKAIGDAVRSGKLNNYTFGVV